MDLASIFGPAWDNKPMTDVTCTVADCANLVLARNRCRKHYRQYMASMSPVICSVDGCSRGGEMTAGLCGMHYKRLAKRGNVAGPDTEVRAATGCSIEGCDGGGNVRHGWCDRHYRRWVRTGSPFAVRSRPSGEGHHNWMGDRIGYSGAHDRVRGVRGSASVQICTECGNQAAEWSYMNNDPAELIEPDGLRRRYSADPAHYAPKCRPCHRTGDNFVRREGARAAGQSPSLMVDTTV
jgi:hypothetical protein